MLSISQPGPSADMTPTITHHNPEIKASGPREDEYSAISLSRLSIPAVQRQILLAQCHTGGFAFCVQI